MESSVLLKDKEEVVEKVKKKSLVERLMQTRLLSFDRLLQFYPMFLFLGLKIRITKDFREVYIRIPLRFYIKNNTGVMFGAAMCTASDPFPALLFQKILPGTIAFTRSHGLEYLRPAKTAVEMRARISDEDLEEIKNSMEEYGKAQKTFEYFFTDKHEKRVAKVTSTAYLRKVKKK